MIDGRRVLQQETMPAACCHNKGTVFQRVLYTRNHSTDLVHVGNQDADL